MWSYYRKPNAFNCSSLIRMKACYLFPSDNEENIDLFLDRN